MSHFYGTIEGSRGEATRQGGKSSGITARAASWAGCVVVDLHHNEATGKDHFVVRQGHWHGRGCEEIIAKGVIGEASGS